VTVLGFLYFFLILFGIGCVFGGLYALIFRAPAAFREGMKEGQRILDERAKRKASLG